MIERITIIGAGNGGQAIAGYCASRGVKVCLYNRNLNKLGELISNLKIHLHGAINAEGVVDVITDDIKTAVAYSDMIFVVTPATAHHSLAQEMLPHLSNGQTIVLNPGRTFGTLEFQSVFSKRPNLNVVVAEAQTLLYACRLQQPGNINVIGVKERVPLVTDHSDKTKAIINNLSDLFPAFLPAPSLLQVGLENIGSIFHPAVILFNAATIERNEPFYFYRDMTPQTASVINQLDAERIAIGKAYGIELMPVEDWIVYAYPDTKGSGLCERMRNNPAYHDILAPGSIFSRQLTEDIPTGIIPMRDLGRIAGVDTPIMDAIITLSSALTGVNFTKTGRTLHNLGLDNLTKQELMKTIS